MISENLNLQNKIKKIKKNLNNSMYLQFHLFLRMNWNATYFLEQKMLKPFQN